MSAHAQAWWSGRPFPFAGRPLIPMRGSGGEGWVLRERIEAVIATVRRPLTAALDVVFPGVSHPPTHT